MNLIHDTVSLEQIKQILASTPRRPLLPQLGTRAWKEAATNPMIRRLMQPLNTLAGRECTEPMPRLTDELYSLYHRTGNRLTFEKPYFERRRRLARAALSLLTHGGNRKAEERLRRSVIAKARAIFEEESWALPAHVTPANGKAPREIDLFCAETANLMAEILDLFGEILPPSLSRDIRKRLREDIFDNYISRHRQFGWYRATNNWNAVCHQGIAGAALSQEDDPERLGKILLYAREALPTFLNGFSADGGTAEGPGYWEYGFGWFSVLNEQLETRSAGRLSLFEGDEKVAQIALFGARMSLLKGGLVNFSDCAGRKYLRPSLLSYLGERLDQQENHLKSLLNYIALASEGISVDDERCDLFYLARLMLRAPRSLPQTTVLANTAKKITSDRFLPDLGVLLTRGTDREGHLWEIAVKSGNNNEPHNHNDCGSYLVNIDGVRMVAEIGAPEYVKDFFNYVHRQRFLAARSLGHSLPVINGWEQASGPEHTSSIVYHEMGPRQSKLLIDLTRSYPVRCGCREFIRTVEFHKQAGRIIVRDDIILSAPGKIEGALISLHPIVLESNHATIAAEGLLLRISPDAGTQLDRVEIHPWRTHEGKDAVVHRLVYTPTSPLCRTRVEVALTLDKNAREVP